MGLYRRKRIIEAIMWHGDNFDKIDALTEGTSKLAFGLLHIKTPAGDVIADIGDMVVKEDESVFRPYKMDVFPEIYEEAKLG